MATPGLDSVQSHLTKTFQVEIASLKHLAEFLVGDDAVNGAPSLFGCYLEFTCDAGTDVDDRCLFRPAAFDKASDRHHRRNDANQVFQELRVVPFDQVNNCRAVGCYQREIRVLFDLIAVAVT